MESNVSEIVDFWLGSSFQGPEQAESRRDVWYHGGPSLDLAIRQRFGLQVEQALRGELDDWQASPEGALALVITLDQFTRHMFRATPRAFAGDQRALAVAQRALASGADRGLPVTGRIFLYHPFHHAESLVLQEQAVALVDGIRRDVATHWHDFLDRRVAGFARHRDIVARFNRFPHRNAILGRRSTSQEVAYLAGDHEDFGQRIAQP